MELLDKLGDAASMFWASLEGRERIVVMYAFALLVGLTLVAGAAERQRRREQELRRWLREELDAAR